MNKPEVIKLIPKEIYVSCSKITKTLKWVDEDGKRHIRKNHVSLLVDFKGTYDNNFHVGNILHDFKNRQTFMATSSNSLSIVNNELENFTTPTELIIIGSAYIEK